MGCLFGNDAIWFLPSTHVLSAVPGPAHRPPLVLPSPHLSRGTSSLFYHGLRRREHQQADDAYLRITACTCPFFDITGLRES